MDRTWKLLEKKCMLIVSCQDESEGRAKELMPVCFGWDPPYWVVGGRDAWEGKHNMGASLRCITMGLVSGRAVWDLGGTAVETNWILDQEEF